MTFDLLSKNFNFADNCFTIIDMAIIFGTCGVLNLDLCVFVINLEQMTFDLLFLKPNIVHNFYTLFITFKPYLKIGLSESSAGLWLSEAFHVWISIEKKKEIWPSPMTKPPTPTGNSKTKGQHTDATKNFELTLIVCNAVFPNFAWTHSTVHFKRASTLVQ